MSSPREWRIEDADDPGDVIEAAETAVRSPAPRARLRAVAVLKSRLADIERDAVDHAISMGLTWSTVADDLGVTRQTVHQKHGGRGPDRPPVKPSRARIEERLRRRKEEEFRLQCARDWQERNRRRREEGDSPAA